MRPEGPCSSSLLQKGLCPWGSLEERLLWALSDRHPIEQRGSDVAATGSVSPRLTCPAGAMAEGCPQPLEVLSLLRVHSRPKRVLKLWSYVLSALPEI